jgi:hypothetical protein
MTFASAFEAYRPLLDRLAAWEEYTHSIPEQLHDLREGVEAAAAALHGAAHTDSLLMPGYRVIALEPIFKRPRDEELPATAAALHRQLGDESTES